MIFSDDTVRQNVSYQKELKLDFAGVTSPKEQRVVFVIPKLMDQLANEQRIQFAFLRPNVDEKRIEKIGKPWFVADFPKFQLFGNNWNSSKGMGIDCKHKLVLHAATLYF